MISINSWLWMCKKNNFFHPFWLNGNKFDKPEENSEQREVFGVSKTFQGEDSCLHGTWVLTKRIPEHPLEGFNSPLTVTKIDKALRVPLRGIHYEDHVHLSHLLPNVNQQTSKGFQSSPTNNAYPRAQKLIHQPPNFDIDGSACDTTNATIGGWKVGIFKETCFGLRCLGGSLEVALLLDKVWLHDDKVCVFKQKCLRFLRLSSRPLREGVGPVQNSKWTKIEPNSGPSISDES